MPERTVDRVIRKVILTRPDDEALKAHCARRGISVERLVEQILSDAAAAARKALADARLEAGRERSPSVSSSGEPSSTASTEEWAAWHAVQDSLRKAAREEAAERRRIEAQARHGAAFMTPAGVPVTTTPDRSMALRRPPVEPDPPKPEPMKPSARPKPSPPADIVAFANAAVALPPRLPALSEAVREPSEKRSYVRLKPLTDEIRGYIEAGYSDAEIALHYGASSAGVQTIRRGLGLASNPRLSRIPVAPVD